MTTFHVYLNWTTFSLFASLLKKYNKIVERLRESSTGNHKSQCNGAVGETSLNDSLEETDQVSISLITILKKRPGQY